MAAAAVPGVSLPGLYRDNLLVAAGWRGNDLVTLAIAVPGIVAARVAGRRGSPAGHLLWTGLADYALYTYLFYLVGSAMNAAFLIYVGVVIAATTALALGVVIALRNGIGRRMAARPARGVALFLVVLATGLGAVHVATALRFVFTGEVPAVVRAVGHPTNVIAALDLWLVVAWSGVAAWWIWRQVPLGFVMAAVVAVKGAVYMPALTAATLVAAAAGADVEVTQAYLWSGIGAACALAAWRLLARAGVRADG